MVDIKKVLNKKSWTGAELGILELTNMAVMFKQALEGKDPQEPVVDEAQLKKMLKSLDRHEGRIYNRYVEIHEWLTVQYNIANTMFQQAQLQTSILLSILTEIAVVEDSYSYMERVPCIMTQKQYDRLVAERLEDYFKDEDGKDAYTDAIWLVYDTIDFFVKKLEREPERANYLKTIKKKYEKESVEDKRIYEAWNEMTGNGYWTLEDGRRSDEMTSEEWDEALVSGGADLWEQADIIFNSETQEEIDEKLRDATFAKTEWHSSPDLPTDIKKWDVIKDPLNILELFQFDPEDTASIEEFMADFPELTKATLKEIDKKLGTEYSSLPAGKWKAAKNKDLYEKDFYGTREWVDSDRRIFEGNLRAQLSGVAILTEESLKFHSTVDEDGNYKEPTHYEDLKLRSLKDFFMESDKYTQSTGEVTRARNALLDSYYYLMGYNYTIEKISQLHDVPEITVFKHDIGALETAMDAFTDLVARLYQQVRRTDYGDKTLRARKLQVLRDYFYPVDYKALQLPEENKEKANDMIASFSAFEPKKADSFTRLLFARPNPLGLRTNGEDSQ